MQSYSIHLINAWCIHVVSLFFEEQCNWHSAVAVDGKHETRTPCCCRELYHDVGAGHLYRKLAPNQWIETSLKLSVNYGEVVKNDFASVQWRIDACRRMVSRDPRTKVHEMRGMFWLARSLTRRHFVALRQKACEISLMEKCCSPEK